VCFQTLFFKEISTIVETGSTFDYDVAGDRRSCIASRQSGLHLARGGFIPPFYIGAAVGLLFQLCSNPPDTRHDLYDKVECGNQKKKKRLSVLP